MIKELKYFLYTITIISFVFFILNYYFSDENKKNSYRSIQSIDKKNDVFVTKLSVLENDTENIIEYVENNVNQNKKTYHFWKLLIGDEK